MKKAALLFGFALALSCSLPLKASASIKVPILNFLLSLQEEQLNQHRNDIDKFIPDDDAEKLILAVITNDLAGVNKFLADPNVDVNDLLDIGIAPLHYIVARKNTDVRILEAFLAEDRVNVNARDRDGETALFYATTKGLLDMVKVLLANNRVDVNAPGGEFSQAPVQQAIATHNVPVIREFLANNRVDINATDMDGDTVLDWAIIAGNPEIIEELISRGAKTNGGGQQEWLFNIQ